MTPGTQIAAGAYANVCAAVADGQLLEFLCVKTITVSDQDALVCAHREVSAIQTLRHPRIVVAVDMWTVQYPQRVLHIALERANTSLADVCARGKLEQPDARLVARHIVSALAYMHAMGFVHRDVKPANVLVFQRQRCFKLCDFGLTTTMPTEMEPSVFQQEPFSGAVVTRYYRAPEVLITRGAYDAGVDVWAAACTIYEALYATGAKPRPQSHRFLFAGATAQGGPTDPDDAHTARENVCAKGGQLMAIARRGALHLPFDMEQATPAEREHLGPALERARDLAASVAPLRAHLIATIGIEEDDADALLPMLEVLPSRRVSCARLATLPYFVDSVPAQMRGSWADLVARVG